jgi:SAM-dependent methyltransferase
VFDHLFARLYDPLLAGAERRGLGAARADLLRDVEGSVLVVGAGTGADLPHLPAGVDRVVLVEPSAPMRDRLVDRIAARTRADAVGSPPPEVHEVVDATAEDLPLDDDSIDHVVLSLVLCTVDDPGRTVDELHRVLRPGGTVRVLEHGRSDHAAGRVAQRVANPAWRVIAAGCNLDRDPAALLARRFDTSELGAVDVPVVSRIGRVTAGVARP